MQKSNKRRAAILVMIIAMVSMIMAGCSALSPKATAESLMNGYRDKTKDKTAVSMHENVDMDISINLLGEETSGSCNIDIRMAMNGKDVRAEAEGITKINGDEPKNEPVTSEIYMLYNEDKDQYDVYTVDKSTGTAVHTTRDAGDDPKSGTMNMIQMPEEAVLEEETEEFSGKECYVVSGKMSWSAIEPAIWEVTETLGARNAQDVDLSDLKLDVKYYFEKDSRELAGAKISGAEAFTEMLDRTMKEAIGFSVNMKISKLDITLDEISFDVEDIVLPDKYKVVEVEAEEQGDGPDDESTAETIDDGIIADIKPEENKENPLAGYDWYTKDGGLMTFDKNGTDWTLYEKQEDRSNNYTSGTYTFLKGQEAIDALESTYAQYGLTGEDMGVEEDKDDFFIIELTTEKGMHDGKEDEPQKNVVPYIGLFLQEDKLAGMLSLIDGTDVIIARADAIDSERAAMEGEIEWPEELESSVSGTDSVVDNLAESFKWDDKYNKVSMEGTEYTLNGSYVSGLLASKSLTLDDEYQGFIVNKKSTYTVYADNGKNEHYSIDAYNGLDTAQEINSCQIAGFSLYLTNDNEPADLEFLGIKFGEPVEKYIEVLGNPTYAYTSDYINRYSWDSDDYKGSISISYNVDSGRPYEFSLHYRQ